MKTKPGIFILTVANILMLPVMFILPFFTVPVQSVIRNTISELGAQYSPHSWMVNSLLAAIAVSSLISGWRCYGGHIFQRIILLLFSISLALTSVINHAPVIGRVQYSIIEDGWHSYLMNTTWISFIILTFSTAMIPNSPVNKFWTVMTGLTAAFLLIMVTETELTTGIWQRVQFIIAFIWMVNTFKTTDQYQSKEHI